MLSCSGARFLHPCLMPGPLVLQPLGLNLGQEPQAGAWATGTPACPVLEKGVCANPTCLQMPAESLQQGCVEDTSEGISLLYDEWQNKASYAAVCSTGCTYNLQPCVSEKPSLPFISAAGHAGRGAARKQGAYSCLCKPIESNKDLFGQQISRQKITSEETWTEFQVEVHRGKLASPASFHPQF